jgi:hypothetical protein
MDDPTKPDLSEPVQQSSARTLLQDWYRRIGIVQKAHFESAMRFGKQNMQLGLPAIIFSTIVGTSVFASLNNDNIPQLAKIAVGLISVVAALLTALQTFLGFSERAEKHRTTAVRYGAVGRQIEQFLQTGSSARQSTDDLVDQIRERLDRLAEESPVLPADIVRQAGIGFPERGIPTVPRTKDESKVSNSTGV